MCIVEMSILYVQPGVDRDPHNCARVFNSYCSETEVYTKVIVVQINGPWSIIKHWELPRYDLPSQAKQCSVTIQYSHPGHGPQTGHTEWWSTPQVFFVSCQQDTESFSTASHVYIMAVIHIMDGMARADV